jgi:hypothetical protein
LSPCLSVFSVSLSLSVFLSLCLYVSLCLLVSLSLCFPVSLSLCLSASLSLCRSVSLSLCLSVSLSLCLSVSLSPCLSVLSVSLSLSVFLSLCLSLPYLSLYFILSSVSCNSRKLWFCEVTLWFFYVSCKSCFLPFSFIFYQFPLIERYIVRNVKQSPLNGITVNGIIWLIGSIFLMYPRPVWP